MHYSQVSLPRRRLEKHTASSEESSESTSDNNDMSDESIAPSRSKKKTGKDHKVGVDPSLGKDSELFGVDLKSVANLEAGLTPSNLGMKTASLFLDQIDAMMAYLRHSNHKAAEGLRDFVEAISNLN